MESSGPCSETPVSVISVFHRTLKRFPKHTALGHKRDGEWKKWTYEEYYRDVRQCARAFLKLGLDQYHGVGIIGFNSPEWFISDLAAIFAG
jgi:long-chain-fatty-acid--CoA ligase ACSBG